MLLVLVLDADTDKCVDRNYCTMDEGANNNPRNKGDGGSIGLQIRFQHCVGNIGGGQRQQLMMVVMGGNDSQ